MDDTYQVDLLGAARLLASPDAGPMLRAALTGDPKSVIPDFDTELIELHYRPGAEVSALYEVSYDAGGDELHVEHLVATTADVVGQIAQVTGAGVVFRIWRHPDDPRLPGLAGACDPDIVQEWLSDSIPALVGAAVPEMATMAYRPLRRAVLQAKTDAGTFYLKILRPGYDDELVKRLDLIADAGLTTRYLARPAPGVVIIPSLDGHSLADQIGAWHQGEQELPTPSELVGVLDQIPAAAMGLKQRRSWPETIGFHTETAIAELSEETAQIRQLSDDIQKLLAVTPAGPLVPVHGDFYEANIFVTPAGLRVIDVDSVGPGYRVDDYACLLGHLAVLDDLDPYWYGRVHEWIDVLFDDFATRVDPVALRTRVAAVLLSLIAGAGPELARSYLATAQRWAADAQR